MIDSFDLDVLGRRVRVDLAAHLDASQRAEVHAAWSGALSAGGNGAPDVTVAFSETASFDAAMERLTVDVTLAALAALRSHALMFHAAGIADDRGRVAAFVGPSGRGKTTISRTLGRHFGYVSDETVAIGENLAVSPYRKPLSLVREGQPKQQVSPQQADLRDLPAGVLRLRALVLLDRDPDLATPEIVTVPLVDAIPDLVAQMSYLNDQEQPLQAIARLSDEVGGVRMLRYPDAATVPPLVAGLLDHPGEPSRWMPAPLPASTAPYGAAGVLDAITTDDRVIVMVDSQVQVLDGIAPTIWLAAAGGADIEEIVTSVVAVHGEPPEADPRVLVSAALDELSAAGILRRR